MGLFQIKRNANVEQLIDSFVEMVNAMESEIDMLEKINKDIDSEPELAKLGISMMIGMKRICIKKFEDNLS